MKTPPLYFVLLLFSTLPVTAQLSQTRRLIGDKQEIAFDSSGRMIGFPNVYAIPQTRLAFRITVPASVMTNEFADFAQKLRATKNFIHDHVHTVNTADSCLFGFAYLAFTAGLDNALLYLDQGIPCDRDTLKKMKDAFASIKFPTLPKPGTATPDTIAASSVIPFELMLKNMLDRQYAVVLYNGNICTDTIFLQAQLTGCRPGCIDFIGEPTAIQDALCKTCGVKNLSQVNFKLLHLDPLRQTIIDWNKIQLSDPMFAVDDQQFNELVSDVCDSTKAIGNLPKKTSLYTKWLLGWLWYTNGKLVWNPFAPLPKTIKDSTTKAIKVKDALLDSAKAMGVFLDSAKTHELKTIVHEYAFTDISNRIKSNNHFIDSVAKKKDTLQQRLTSDKVVEEIKKVGYLYDGVVKLSRYGGLDHSALVYPQKQFDAAMNFQPIPLNNRHRAQVTEVPENEKLYFLVHNIANGARIRIFDSPLPFNDLEEFTKLVNEQLSLINFSDVTSAMLQKLGNFAASLAPYSQKLELTFDSAGVDSTKPDCHIACVFLKELKREKDANGVGFLPKIDLFDERTLSDPVYSTYMQAANVDEAPYKDTFTIKLGINKDSAVMKSSVRIGKLRYVEIAAGIAFTKHPIYTTTIDTASGGFHVSSQDNRARAIVGFKFYPWKNFRRDNSLIPRYLFRRLSVFGGFEILKPLENFYVGGAYDVVPGLAFSMGTNYYLQTNYRIQNNTITDTYRTYKHSSPYYAVMVNPVLFVQFVKLFFK